MSAPQEHPVTHLRELAEQSAKLLWKSYDLHHDTSVRDQAWYQKGRELLALCLDGDARVWRLKELEVGRRRPLRRD